MGETDNKNIDVEKYIHADDESDIGLDIFKESSSDSIPLKRVSNSSVKIPDEVKKITAAKQRKKANQKIRTYVTAVIVFMLCTAVGLGVVFAVAGSKNGTLNVNFRYSTDNKEVGNVNNIIKREKNYAYGVYYPTFSKVSVDEYISQQNDTIIDEFLSLYKHYKPEQKGTGAVLFSDYDSTDFVDYYQIVRKTEYRIPGEKTVERICTVFYDIKNDKVLKGSDFFDSNFKQIISVKAAKYLQDNTELKEEEIDEITNYRKINIDNFSFDRDNFYLYLKASDGSTLTLRFNTDSSITGHFKINFKTLNDNYELAHRYVEDDSQTQEETTAQENEENTLVYESY